MIRLPLSAYLAAGLAVALAGWTIHAGRLADRAKLAEAARDVAVLQAQAAVREWELDALSLQGELAACQAQWLDAQTRAAESVAQAEAGRERAERALADYRQRWSERSQSCGAALLAAEAACPELEGY